MLPHPIPKPSQRQIVKYAVAGMSMLIIGIWAATYLGLSAVVMISLLMLFLFFRWNAITIALVALIGTMAIPLLLILEFESQAEKMGNTVFLLLVAYFLLLLIEESRPKGNHRSWWSRIPIFSKSTNIPTMVTLRKEPSSMDRIELMSKLLFISGIVLLLASGKNALNWYNHSNTIELTSNEKNVIISGTVEGGSKLIEINKAKLGTFKAGDTQWSYLTQDLKPGKNDFRIVVRNENGTPSDPSYVSITYVPEVKENLTQETEPTTGKGKDQTDEKPEAEGTTPEKSNESVPERASEIIITTPPEKWDDGTWLLRGTPPEKTSTIKINGFQLNRFVPDDKMFNYYLSSRFRNLKPGDNSYTIEFYNINNTLLQTWIWKINIR